MQWVFFSRVNGSVDVLKRFLRLPEVQRAQRRVCLGGIVTPGGAVECRQEIIGLVRGDVNLSLKTSYDVEYLTRGQLSGERT